MHMPEDSSAALVKPAAVQLLALHAGGQDVILDAPLSCLHGTTSLMIEPQKQGETLSLGGPGSLSHWDVVKVCTQGTTAPAHQVD